jgi:hypothetical protein
MDVVTTGAGGYRIGATERDAAVAALDAHREAGRLSSAEYEDRSVRAGSASNWADLDALFADLPEPHPRPGSLAPAAGLPAPAGDGAPARRGDGLVPDRWAGRIVALAPLVAIVLFFSTGSWVWFLLIPAVSILVWGGKDRHHH